MAHRSTRGSRRAPLRGASALLGAVLLLTLVGCATAPAQPPVKTAGPEPTYPEELAEENIAGWVIVQALVDKEGRVSRARAVKSSDPRFEASAVEMVRKWEFEPATHKGKPVEVHYTLTVNFEPSPEAGSPDHSDN